MTDRTCTATIMLAASLLGLAGFTAPASAQRASCGQIQALIASESALLDQARADLRQVVSGFAINYADEAEGGFMKEGRITNLTRQGTINLQRVRSRVARHQGNVARLQSQYGRMGCNETQQARQPGVDPAAAAAIGIGIGVLMGGYSGGGYRGSRGYGSSGGNYGSYGRSYGGSSYRRY